MFETGLQLLHFDIQIDFGYLDNLDGDSMTFLNVALALGQDDHRRKL
jgi:hypothetical protein